MSSWEGLARTCREPDGQVQPAQFVDRLLELAADQYANEVPSARLVEFVHGPGTYLFDQSGDPQEFRTVLAVGSPSIPRAKRDVSYQRRYPAPKRIGGRPVDRGHFLPFSAAGLYGPNLFVQDRALNRGWSADGRRYRAMERAAVARQKRAVMFVRPIYCDNSAVPELLDVGVLTGPDLDVQRFRNRFDTLPVDADQLEVHLMAAADAQIGDLGEEASAVLLEERFGATTVSMGDAGMPRAAGRQDLDLVAIIDGELIVFEIKSRFRSKLSGRLTRAGNLLRPRLRRSRASGVRQGSQRYVATRLQNILEIDDKDYEGVQVRVMLVDLRAMLMQQFRVDDAGSRLTPIDKPIGCRGAVEQALAQILAHRGYL